MSAHNAPKGSNADGILLTHHIKEHGRAWAVSLLLDRQVFAADTGVWFRGMTISQAGHQWRVIIRAGKRDGTPVYCMQVGDEPDEVLANLMHDVSSRGGASLWHFDRYAAK